ncbi:MAG: beta strand repeat-containing protein, partial [Rhizomicrobium sp.]
WTYTLTVNRVTITQTTPTTGTTTTAASAAFTTQLAVIGNVGPVTYHQATGTATGSNVHVASTGAVTIGATLATGTYTVTGAVTDGYGDTGTWTYTLTVSPVTIAQTAPTTGTTSIATSANFTAHLAVIGNIGPVTFTQTTGSNVHVASTGAVTTGAILAAGTYTASGTVTDAYGDTGTWSYTLTVNRVTIAQTAPITGTTTTATSGTFTTHLAVTGNVGPVTYHQATGTEVHVAPTGTVTTGTTLAAGTYAASGTVTDAYGDTGTWSYTLTVSAAVIVQTVPTTGTTTTATSAAFTAQLSVTGNVGPVTYAQTTGTGLSVSASGKVTTTGTLSATTYTASGTVTDGYGDTGTWTYTLTVNPVAITQTTPTTGTATTATSAAFTAQLSVTGNVGPVTYTQATGTATAPELHVTPTGAVTTGTTLAIGTYTATGSVTDAFGDTGTWTYTLTVDAGGLVQTNPFTYTVSPAQVAGFYTHLHMNGATGTVTFTQISGTGLTVSSTGKVVPDGALGIGTYTASGHAADSAGHTGTWTYTLYVANPKPSATTVAPTSGSTAGGTTVTVTGHDFETVHHVTFGFGNAGTTLHVTSPTKLTVKTPPHAAGTVTVLVTTSSGTSGPGLYYTYAAT